MSTNQNDTNFMHVRKLWDRYSKDFPSNLDPQWYSVLQKTFYSGFVTGAGTVIQTLSTGDKAHATSMITDIQQELDTFEQLVKMKVI